MSKARPDLPNGVEDVKAVISRYSGSGLFTSIHLGGSRSPKSSKKPRDNSDWDLLFVTVQPNVRLPSLRLTGQLHGDAVVLTPGQLAGRKGTVQVWPNDPHGAIYE